MDQTLLDLAGSAAPRYTSYPTAPHFSPAVDAHTFGAWLDAIPAGEALSLYIHVPYCRELCWYCGCNTAGVRREELIASFVETLKSEIDLASERLRARQVREVHWGGGTPNVLSPAQFTDIFAHLASTFDLTPLTAHAVEVDPRSLTAAHAAAMAACGVNRASLGVQDLNPVVQAAMGRVQPLACVVAAVNALRDAGIADINFDLMYGLPGQTLDDVERTILETVAIRPGRIALFGYAHVPWFKKRQRLIDETTLPDTSARLLQAARAAGLLEAAGYRALGLDHYALPEDPLARAADAGHMRRNFQGYVASDITTIIGLGPSAISTTPAGYAQNVSETGAWRRAIVAGHFATARGHALSADDRIRARLIEQVLCGEAVDLADLGPGFDAARARLLELAGYGVVRIEGARASVPPGRRAYARLVAQAFDAFAARGEARHSRAV